jgi:hypothetical protein
MDLAQALSNEDSREHLAQLEELAKILYEDKYDNDWVQVLKEVGQKYSLA